MGTVNLYHSMLALIVLLIIIVIVYSFKCVRGDLDALAQSEPMFGDVC